MLKLETQFPGFGGFFIDSGGNVIVWLKRSGEQSAGSLRAALAAKYASHENAYVREVMAPASHAEVRPGDYSLSELVAIESRIAHSPIRLKGYAGVGTSPYVNRVKVGFATAPDVEPGVSAIVSLGVPLDAIVPEVWGENHLSGTWSGKYRPTRGGIKTAMKSVFAPGSSTIGSHGYNVRADDEDDYLLLAAHQANSLRAINGVTGDEVYQPDGSDAFNVIAEVTNNPAWKSGTDCDNNPLTGVPYEFCTPADVAAAQIIGGITGERKIGTSMYEGSNGGAGTQDINNWYPIKDIVEVAFIQQFHNVVHKSGQATGTTTGFIDLPCANIPFTVPWGSPIVPKTIELQCHVRVGHAGWGFGDSGAPVFARNANNDPDYHALGIMVGGNGSTSNGVCNAGQLCSFVFAPWGAIEAWLGHLYLPQTVIQ